MEPAKGTQKPTTVASATDRKKGTVDWLKWFELECPAAFRVLMEHKRATEEGLPFFPKLALKASDLAKLKGWLTQHGPKSQWDWYAKTPLVEIESWLIGQDRDLIEARKLKFFGLAFGVLFRVVDQNDQAVLPVAEASNAHESEVANPVNKHATPDQAPSESRQPKAPKAGRQPKVPSGLSPEAEDAVFDEWLDWVGKGRMAGFRDQCHPEMTVNAVRAAIKHARERRRKAESTCH